MFFMESIEEEPIKIDEENIPVETACYLEHPDAKNTEDEASIVEPNTSKTAIEMPVEGLEGITDSIEEIKHPLQNAWTLWYLENDRKSKKSWEESLVEVATFDTVEDFWSLYNHIKQASEIKPGSDYSLFKKGIRPMWEDAANKRGGRWVIVVGKSVRHNDVDTLWLDVLLCMIGESFTHADEICGAVLNNRPKGHRISLWTADGSNQEAALEIGYNLCESLKLAKTDMVYQLHRDTMINRHIPIRTTYILR